MKTEKPQEKTQETMRKEEEEYYKGHPFYETYEEIRRRDIETMKRRQQ